MDKKNCYF